MSAQQHRIRRQRWRIRTRSREAAFGARAELRTAIAGALDEVFSRAFDNAVRPDEVVHLAKLELDVRVRSIAELELVLPELLERAVKERLAQDSVGTSESTSSDVRATSRAHAITTLVRYLSAGSLPWSAKTWQRSEAVTWLRSLSRADVAAALSVVVARSGSETALTAYFRALQIVAESNWSALLQTGSAALGLAGTGDFAATLAALAQSPTIARDTKLRFAAAVMVCFTSQPHVAAFAFLSVAVEAGGDPARAAKLLVEMAAPAAKASLETWLEPVRMQRPKAATASGDAADTRTVKPRDTALGATDPAALILATASAPPVMDETFGTLVSFAGLVLLHPYLARFLSTLGIQTERQDKGLRLRVADLPRAAALLVLLASGEDEALEPDLGLVKVLLGLKFDEPLSFGSGLVAATDRNEANTLLDAVIAHWGGIGRTSAAGLRATFLDRPGLLRETATGLCLQVEPKGVDVLLGRLPWSIGVLKLPWMKKPIFTEWTSP